LWKITDLGLNFVNKIIILIRESQGQDSTR